MLTGGYSLTLDMLKEKMSFNHGETEGTEIHRTLEIRIPKDQYASTLLNNKIP